jgi:hypothetical protein
MMKKSDELIWAGIGFDPERATTEETKERTRLIDLLETRYSFGRVGSYRDCIFKGDDRSNSLDVAMIIRRDYFIGFGIVCQTEEQAREKLPLLEPVFWNLQIIGQPGIWKLYFAPFQIE